MLCPDDEQCPAIEQPHVIRCERLVTDLIAIVRSRDGTDAAWQSTAACACGMLLGEGALDAPIVRHVQRSPAGIIAPRLLPTRHIAKVEFPARIEVDCEPPLIGRRCTAQEQGEADQRDASGVPLAAHALHRDSERLRANRGPQGSGL